LNANWALHAVSEAAVALTTLKRRAEFLRVRGGARWSTPAFVLEARKRASAGSDATETLASARFGFTVTKRIGKAVVRNRVRRRLKALVTASLELARPDFDYVVIAGPAAIDRAYGDLRADLAHALVRVHRASGRGRKKEP
jgi:ribonuclease P protein component